MADVARSVIIKKFGDYSVISVDDFPLPPADGLVEVKVEYGGVNFYDLYTRQGAQPVNPPLVTGIECSGTIVSLDNVDSTALKVGQRVICYDYTGGLHRTKVRVSPSKCYPLPDDVSFETGAAIFVNYLTAYFALFEVGNLRAGESVLILSCAGGVGCAAVQLATSVQNVTIFGTTSTAKNDSMLKMGVSRTFDLSSETFEKEIAEKCPEGFDLIISNQSGSNFSFLQTLLKPLGRIVLLGANDFLKDERKINAWNVFKGIFSAKDITLESLMLNSRIVGAIHMGLVCDKCPDRVNRVLEEIWRLYRDGKIAPVIDSIHDMANVVRAHKRLGYRENVGKVLIKFDDKI